MEREDTQATGEPPREQDPDVTDEGAPIPDPEREDGGRAEDVPDAD